MLLFTVIPFCSIGIKIITTFIRSSIINLKFLKIIINMMFYLIQISFFFQALNWVSEAFIVVILYTINYLPFFKAQVPIYSKDLAGYNAITFQSEDHSNLEICLNSTLKIPFYNHSRVYFLSHKTCYFSLSLRPYYYYTIDFNRSDLAAIIYS